jgi:curved DNA-binding protein CbpA
VTDDPFTTLGLPAWAGLTDEDVRAAWRRIAAATHPDREDGGEPARFGAAAAAYATLRTSFGRGEALADLGPGGRPGRGRRRAGRGSHRATGRGAHAGWLRAGRAGRGWAGERPGSLVPGWGLGLRVASAAVLAAATVAAVGVTPATIGLLAGALTVSGWALWRRGGWGR